MTRYLVRTAVPLVLPATPVTAQPGIAQSGMSPAALSPVREILIRHMAASALQ